jgi:hypothetical protein
VAVDQVQKIDPTTHASKYSLTHVHCCASEELSSEYERIVSIKQRLSVFSRQEKRLLHIMVACGARVGRGVPDSGASVGGTLSYVPDLGRGAGGASGSMNGKHLNFRLNFPPNFRLNYLRVLVLGFRV